MDKINLFKNKMTIKRFSFLVLEIIAFTLLLWFYARHSLILSDPSKPYSDCIAYRLQTDAFLQGKLFLSHQPFGALQDFLWTEHGLSQNWGLGIPLLRLPFEWTAKELGPNPFPDKFTLIFYLSLMVLIFNLTLRGVLTSFGLAVHSFRALLLRWYLLSLILFSPAILGLLRIDFNVYHEAVFYGFIYSCLLFAFLLLYLRDANNKLFLGLSLLSGFACLIRPTLVFEGLITFLLAATYLWNQKQPLRIIFLGAICFSLGIGLDLWSNYLRFGSLFEFGYSASLNGGPPSDYGLRFFDYPFLHENFVNAGHELLSALFQNHSWTSSTFRDKEYAFESYNLFYFICLAIATIIFTVLSYFVLLKKEMNLYQRNAALRTIYFSLAWGLLNFVALFVFYLHYSYLTDRYLCDFAASLNAIIIALILLFINLMNPFINIQWNKKLLIGLLLLVGPLFYFNHKAYFLYQGSIPRCVNTIEVQRLVNSFNQRNIITPTIPETFYCGKPLYLDLIHQFEGWNIAGDCSVSSASSIYLPSKKCLIINYSLVNHQQSPPIRVKRNLVFLKLVRSDIIQDNAEADVTQEFCTASNPPNTVAIYTIGWVEPKKANWDTVPIVLHWIGVSDDRR